LPVAIAFLTTENVAADSFVEDAKTVGHEVADVGKVEERQRNAEQSVDYGYDTAQSRLRSDVTITYHIATAAISSRPEARLTLARILFPQCPAIWRAKSCHFSGTKSVKMAR